MFSAVGRFRVPLGNSTSNNLMFFAFKAFQQTELWTAVTVKMWAILSVILHVLSKDPSASTSSGALWALQVAWRTRSLDLPVCVTVQDTIFENRQRVNKTASTITKRFNSVCSAMH